MAKRKRMRVSVWLRARMSDGKQRYIPAVENKDFTGLVNGKRVWFKSGDARYHLRYTSGGKRIWEKVEGGVFAAFARRAEREGALAEGSEVSASPTTRLTLAEQKKQFMELKNLQKKADGFRLDTQTVIAYEQRVTEFLTVIGKTYPDQVTGMDLRRYMAALEARGLSHRSICNHYISIVAFLGFCTVDHKKLLPQSERPHPHDAEPTSYTFEEVSKFLSVIADERDRLAFEFLLKTGAREQEMAHATWTDISGGTKPTVIFRNKAELDFRVKTGKSRVVPLERGLSDRLTMWHEKNPDAVLIFGRGKDAAEGHFLRKCKEYANLAKVSCGKCGACVKSQSCESWYLHKFRDTFATWSLRAGTDIRTVQAWLGHSSLEMTMRYLEPARGEVGQEKIKAAFGLSLELASAATAVQ